MKKFKKKFIISINKSKKVNNYIQTVISFINSINNEISYYKGLIDQIKDHKNKINLSSRFSLMPIIILVNKNPGKDNDEENKEDKNE